MQSNFSWPARVLAATIVVLLLAGSPALAVVLTTNGFEYTANPNRQFVGGNNLAGQQGWKGDDPLIDTDPSSTAVIVDTEAADGTQSLEVNRLPNSDRRWALPVSGLPTGRHIVISWDQKTSLTGDNSVYGPLLGVEAYDGTGVLALIGSVFVDGSTGDVIYQAANTGFVTDSGLDVVDNQWTKFEMTLDFDLEKYTVKMQRPADADPVLVVTEDFVDKNLGTGIDAFTDADIAAIAGHPDPASQAATGQAWFDNFVVRNSLFRGDFNGDGVVDARDYVLWRNNHGNVGLTQAADGNGDGLVNHLDYEIWKEDYEASRMSGGLVLSPAQVPEPASLGLVLLAAGALAWRFRRV